MQTQLHRLLNPHFYAYQDPPWQIFLRKEVPEPGEADGGRGALLEGQVRWSRARAPATGAEGPSLGVRPGTPREGLWKALAEAPPPQVFYPKDNYNHPVQLDLLFRQVSAPFPVSPAVLSRVLGNGLAVCGFCFCTLGVGAPVWMGSCSTASPPPMMRVSKPTVPSNRAQSLSELDRAQRSNPRPAVAIRKLRPRRVA